MDAHYRVAIFGSARIKEGDQKYNDVFNIAKGLAEGGMDVVTGGGPGIMQAANAGHKSASKGTHSIGLNIKLPFEQDDNKFLDIKKDFDRFSNRLDAFMSLSDAVVVATGGIGTILELFYTWQLVQVQHLCETPIILFKRELDIQANGVGSLVGTFMTCICCLHYSRSTPGNNIHPCFGKPPGNSEDVVVFVITFLDSG
jgi:uncharacterized protein (TIGR00725 family)